MNALLGILFLFGIIGTWYFAEKRSNKHYRNISIGVKLLIVVLICFTPSSYFFFVTDSNMRTYRLTKMNGNFESDGLNRMFIGIVIEEMFNNYFGTEDKNIDKLKKS
ncbi:hypothetical protein TEHN7128_1620 [Tetragenococcus halophilus subsp. halophilus]|uniref:Uncharacterized protein n=2 Tax=Tetragenococcus halophilus TaxID=51669 RepID=A0A2H6DME3_TETHA|nr:hypothetical protein [Tetragenococcus halophilus]MCO8297975.1 hypothetical protein [Tetragenococcus halophilus]GBD66770.1 hypothetical protein TEHN7116_1734 [Tetragenococcus halophilus subsp. halophilus]GBD68099.1 hypothetical protein TEHN7118_0905 [Tetragenococcus halophilus subsp. halophilus]GBD78391.1 hypothetical protein TEHN7128_1620 [Tetragenococcus halophilus subsp. halophilus]